MTNDYWINVDRILFSKEECGCCPIKTVWAHYLRANKKFPVRCLDCKYIDRMRYNCGREIINVGIKSYKYNKL